MQICTEYVMTGLEKIIDQIRQDAEANATHKLGEAKNKAQAVLNSAKEESEMDYTQLLKGFLSQSEDVLSRAKSAAQLNTRRLVLAKKQELIAKTVENAKEKLLGLPDAQYFEMLLKLVEKSATGEKGDIQLCKKDMERLPADFEGKLPSSLSLLKVPSDSLNSGFLLIYGGIDVNCSVEALFAAASEELQDKAAAILFKK